MPRRRRVDASAERARQRYCVGQLRLASRALQTGPVLLAQHDSLALQQALPQQNTPLAQDAVQGKAVHCPAAQ